MFVSVVSIDGSMGEGGGQILRTAVTLSTIYGKPINIFNIRAGRKEPGLRPQHLQAIISAAEMCNALTKGANVGSTALEFIPRELPRNYEKTIDTGTAGSITLIAQTLIPISIFRSVNMNVEIVGGTEVPHAPTIDYLLKIVLPVYKMLGADVSIDIRRRGYYPRGGGRITVRCKPSATPAEHIRLERGKVEEAKILSVSRSLPEHVSKRQMESAVSILKGKGVSNIKTQADSIGESLSPGSSILVYSDSHNNLIGSSALGERGKRAEIVGEEASNRFLIESRCNPSADSHLADMLTTILACLPGQSEFTTTELSNHFRTNISVCEAIVKDVSFKIDPPKESTDEYYNVKVSGARPSEKSN